MAGKMAVEGGPFLAEGINPVHGIFFYNNFFPALLPAAEDGKVCKSFKDLGQVDPVIREVKDIEAGGDRLLDGFFWKVCQDIFNLDALGQVGI